MSRLILTGILWLICSMVSQAQDSLLIVNSINVRGNRTTKEYIILREVSFRKGDSLSASELDLRIARSRENLLNTSLFNYVTITRIPDEDGGCRIDVAVEERWYTWPAILFQYADRNFSAWLKTGDFSRLNYGFAIEKYNCFGRRENLRFSFLFGIARQFVLSYRNIALDVDRKHFIGAEIELSGPNEIIYLTSDNKPLTYRNETQPVYRKQRYTFNYLYRPLIDNTHNFLLSFYRYNISDSVLTLNYDYLLHGQDEMNYLNLDYIFAIDNRDSKVYPLKGRYFELLAGETFSVGGKPFSSTVLVPSYFRYFQISRNFFYATGASMKLSYNSGYSYLYSKGLGYNYNMHGFEYNTMEGQYFLVYKNLIKMALLHPRVTELTFLNVPKFNKIHYAFYLNLFADCGYVSNKYNTPDNNYINRFLFSAGAGVDFVTYYDRTFRAEYSINGFGKAGLYFHYAGPMYK